MQHKEISIVIPVCNEEENVRELFLKIRKVLEERNKIYEVIFVDDGSEDRTFEVLKELSKENRQLKALRFRKNFGKSAALSAGFELAQGNLVITLDGDLQDDPEEIPNFLEKIKEGYDLVVGWRSERRDPLRKKLASKIFNKLTSGLTGVKIHDSNCCFKIFKKEVVKDIAVHGEQHRYIPALAHLQGYRVGEIRVRHHHRKRGKSKYGRGRLVKGFLDLITVKFLSSYLNRPIHFFGWAGLISLLFGFLSALGAILFKMRGVDFDQTPLPLFTVFSILVGVQFILMGILAEILIKVYYESPGKKPYSIKDKLNLDDDSTA